MILNWCMYMCMSVELEISGWCHKWEIEESRFHYCFVRNIHLGNEKNASKKWISPRGNSLTCIFSDIPTTSRSKWQCLPWEREKKRNLMSNSVWLWPRHFLLCRRLISMWLLLVTCLSYTACSHRSVENVFLSNILTSSRHAVQSFIFTFEDMIIVRMTLFSSSLIIYSINTSFYAYKHCLVSFDLCIYWWEGHWILVFLFFSFQDARACRMMISYSFISVRFHFLIEICCKLSSSSSSLPSICPDQRKHRKE